MVTVVMSEPKTATRTSSSRKLGSVWKASVTRISTSSTQLPWYPASAPMTIPTAIAMEVATTPISSEMRAPWKICAAMSRPELSVPSRKRGLAPGHCSGRPASESGSRGKNQSAVSAMPTTASSSASPMIAGGLRR
jgi:hypothetical protein